MRRIALLIAALTAALALPPVAGAQNFEDLYQDYQKNGSINGCNYSNGQLRRGAGQVPPDIEQYAPDFADRLNAARDQRAGGGCTPQQRAQVDDGGGGGGAAAGAGGGPGAAGRPDVSDPPRPKREKRSVIDGIPSPKAPAGAATAAIAGDAGGAPWPIWVLSSLVAIMALGLAVVLVGRFFGWSPERFTGAPRGGGQSPGYFARMRERMRFRL